MTVVLKARLKWLGSKTINDYLKVISEKDSGLAARMKAEFQMFGLKNPAELNAIVKKVVEDSTK